MTIYKNGTNKDFETFIKKCWCGTCGALTEDQLREIYNSKLIIAENSKDVYNPFTEHTRSW